MRDDGRLVGIIGGTGRMGELFAGVFEGAGCIVEVIGRADPDEYRAFARRCSVILVSVPIDVTEAVIASIAPVLEEDQLIADLTSLKVMPVSAMMASRAEVIGLHPLFGPNMATLSGQKMIMTPARSSRETADWLREIFEATGMSVAEATPEEHDHAMAVMQGLIHFQSMVLAMTLRGLDLPISRLLPYATPNAHASLAFMTRTLSQDGGLYGGMLLGNQEIQKILGAYALSVNALKETIDSKDPEAFVREFEMDATFTREFSDAALLLTDLLLDMVVREW
ncbi:prephenate dehydrogenase [Methanocalculus alkaliphilus]|nr:prephenate dehydrogenase [Methanocalculus alkaliphilus]